MDGKNIIIIGGGPAGMMAAISAASKGCRVTLIEKNTSCGKKLLLTGNGRCNFTNSRDIGAFLSAFGKNGPFLRDAFKSLFNNDLIKFFESRGLKCKADEEGRVFPLDNKASSVLKALEDELAGRNVNVVKGSPLMKILTEDGHVSGVKLGNGNAFACRAVILATGGLSYPATGSTGEGLKIARSLGHTITALKPALVPVAVREKYPKFLMGLSLSGVSVKIVSEGRKFHSGKGDIIFTSRGLSGPLILSSSSAVSDLLGKGKTVHLSIDLFPDIPDKDVLSMLSRELEENPSRAVKNCLKSLFPQRLADLFLELSAIDKDKVSNQVTQKERAALASLSKEFKLTVAGTSEIEEAMVTRGGISLKEIDPRTMASKIVRGLYFAGEMIDIDGDTGGFNLQAAFSTGYLAGLNATS